MADALIVFDMDGVLVDVTDSYRETIVQTIRHFTGRVITRSEIQDYKNQGGYNDDWKLCHQVVRGHGLDVDFQTVVDHFQSLFHGNGTDGLILRERWIATDGLFERLAQRCDFALFTGRLRWEADCTLSRFASTLRFDPIVGLDDVQEPKPSPEGLLKISSAFRGSRMWYVGDTVDDARAARAAGVPFIGIAAPESPRRPELVAVFEAENAIAVLDDINQLESVIA